MLNAAWGGPGNEAGKAWEWDREGLGTIQLMTVFIMAAIQLTKYNGSNHTQYVIATIYNA